MSKKHVTTDNVISYIAEHRKKGHKTSAWTLIFVIFSTKLGRAKPVPPPRSHSLEHVIDDKENDTISAKNNKGENATVPDGKIPNNSAAQAATSIKSDQQTSQSHDDIVGKFLLDVEVKTFGTDPELCKS